MNIEEERKAFEAEVLKTMEPGFLRRWLVDGVEQYGLYECQYNFDIWLAAKTHAAEMAKPVATWYETMGDKFALVCSGDNERRLFESVAEAKVWAQANGYRVVDE